MKKGLCKSDVPRQNARFNPFKLKPTAMALAFLSVASGMPIQSAYAQGEFALEEIVVTARKREETLQEVPVAVNVLSSDVLGSSRIEGISDLGSVVPGLVTGNVAASTAGSIYLRGVGTGAGNPTFDQAVAINLDGVVISSAQLMNAGMFDLDRIEVLRGPQALFYGKNSPGGVIAIHTQDPGDELELQLSGHYETETGEQAFRGIVSGAITDTLGGRLSLGWTENDDNGFRVENEDVFLIPGVAATQVGFATDSYPTSNENLFVMGTLAWDPTEDVSVNFKYAHLENDQEGQSSFTAQRIACPQGAPVSLLPTLTGGAPGVVAGFDDCEIDDNTQMTGLSPALIALDPNFPNHTGNGFNNFETDFAAMNVTIDLTDDITLTSVTGYFEAETSRLSEASYDVWAFLGNSSINTLEQWSQEIRVTSAFEGPVNFSAGLFYEEKDVSDLNSVTVATGPIGTHLVDSEATAYSVFGQVEWNMSEQWTLAAGLRYSYEEKEGEIGATDLLGFTTLLGFPSPIDSVSVPLADDNPDWSNVSPELTLRYQYNEDIMFFASYKTAFKSGGIDGSFKGPELLFVTEVDATYDEENIDGFEVGMKSTLADGTLRLNVTAYSYEYEDMQLSDLQQGTFGPTLTTFNAGTASLEGLEIETIWLTPVEGLTLTANVALSDNTFDEFTANCLTGQTVSLGCDVDRNGDGLGDGADKAGETLPNSSDVSATFGLDYLVAVNDNWNVGFNFSTSYKDDYNPTPELLPRDFHQDAYWWTNAAVTLSSSDDKWEFYVRGVNLGDEYFTTNMATVPSSGNGALTGVDTGIANDRSGLGDMFGFVDGGRRVTLGFTYRLAR